MSDETGDNPPPPEKTSSGDGEATKQEEKAPPPSDPVEEGEADVDSDAPADTNEDAATEADESADDDTAPPLTESEETEPAEEATGEEPETEPESASEVETEPEPEADEADPPEEDAQTEGSEQPLPADLEQHIFDGEIKTDRNGDYYAAGYHHREGGVDEGDLTVDKPGPTDSHGVYEAKVTGTAPDGTEVTKERSSFFPDSYSKEDVRNAVREAWDNRTESSPANPREWEGVTSDGITVQGWIRPGTTVADATEDDIRTAYPLWGR